MSPRIYSRQRHQVARSSTQRDLPCEEDPASPVLLALIKNH